MYSAHTLYVKVLAENNYTHIEFINVSSTCTTAATRKCICFKTMKISHGLLTFSTPEVLGIAGELSVALPIHRSSILIILYEYKKCCPFLIHKLHIS